MARLIEMMNVIDLGYLTEHFPHRPDDAHKGTMGTLCSLTGSVGFSGAAILSAEAALRSGVGLHYQILPQAIYPIFASAIRESVCIPTAGGANGGLCRADMPAIAPYLRKATAVLVGCGMGNNADTAAVLHDLLSVCTCPVVIDADGINTLAQNIHLLESAPSPIILTPHVKEFSRLSKLTVEEILCDPEGAAADFMKRYPGVTLVLKNHQTIIAKDGRLYLNTAGNSGMAKGGSGDVLAGIIASLAAQGAQPYEAAVMGVYIHALAGDRAAQKFSKTAMLPSDIIRALPEVYKRIESSRNPKRIKR